MRKQPQEFGFGVRGVQASPVDTFSPEVVQKPRAARGQAVSQGLSNLSQTLAGMAQQNRKYDDSTLQPLANAVYTMREEGKSDAQIEKAVSTQGLTSARVLSRIRKGGGFDAFTDPAFRITYDELQGIGKVEDAVIAMAEVDQVARNLAAGLGIDDDPEEMMAQVEALYNEAISGVKKGLSPFALAAFNGKVNPMLTDRSLKAIQAGRRAQEVDYANLTATDVLNSVDGFIGGLTNGFEMNRELVSTFKQKLGNVAPQDVPAFLSTVISGLEARLEVAASSNMIPEEHQDDIEELFEAFEDAIPEDVLDANPEAQTQLNGVKAKYYRTEEDLENYRARGERRNSLSSAEINNIAVAQLSAVHEGDFGAYNDLGKVEEALNYTRALQSRLQDMPAEDRATLAERLRVPEDQLDEVVGQLSNDYARRSSEIRGEERSSLLFDQSQQDRLSQLDERARRQADKDSAEARSVYSGQIRSAGIQGRRASLEGIAQAIRGDGTLTDTDRELLLQEFDLIKSDPGALQQIKQLAQPSTQAAVQALVGAQEETPPDSAISDLQIALAAEAEDIALAMLTEPGMREKLAAGETAAIQKELNDRVRARAEEFALDTFIKDPTNDALDAISIRGLVSQSAAGLNFEGVPLTNENAREGAQVILQDSLLNPTTQPKEYARLVNETVEGYKAVNNLGSDWLMAGLTRHDEFKGRLTDEADDFMRGLEGLVDQAQDPDHAVSSSAKKAIRSIILDMGIVPMQAEGSVLESIRAIAGVAPEEVIEEGDYYQKEAIKFAEFFNRLQESSDFTLRFNSYEEALRYRAAEFQTNGIFHGMYDSNTGDLDTSKTFTSVDAKGNETTLDFKDVVKITRDFLSTNIRGFNPSNQQVLDFIYRQSVIEQEF